ncbi:hypothetical protein Acsp02_23130 [Actinoplanes sp. NBRC 103695]|nr:hypothetical protein Acsp02_23130 [Actinoplanes sp. NBRC 103695]
MLPALLAAGQLLAWPGAPLLTGSRPPAAAIAAVLAITAAAAVALLWRRSSPVAAAVVANAALTAGSWGLPEDALSVIALADLIALFSVAARRPARVALLVAAALSAAQSVVFLTDGSRELSLAVEIALTVTVYLIVLAAGRRHARWRAERAAAAERFALAEQRRARAAEIERLRLTQELHDVTAHHLTSIVVAATAAQSFAPRPGDAPVCSEQSGPERDASDDASVCSEQSGLVAETLDQAARTGRTTLEALRRLVAIMQTPAPPALPALVASFRDAGQPVTLTAPAGPLPDAVPAIAREALTNALRYAPGTPTRVTVTATPAGAERATPSGAERATPAGAEQATPTGLELTVENDPPGAPPAGPSIGGGNGITGMRERARSAGGDLDAGPLPGGGWRVRATLPAPVSAAARPARPWSAHVIDAILIAGVMAVPAAAAWAFNAEEGLDVPGGAALMAAIVAIHALPLALRRTRPWTTLAAVAVTGACWTATIWAGLLPAASGWIPIAAIGADLLAVHAVGRYGRRSRVDWLALPAGVLPAGLSIALAFAAEPPAEPDQPSQLVMVVLFTALFAGLLAVPLGAAWLTGWLVRRRRARITGNEDEWMAWSAHHASVAASAERARIAEGLGEAVLRHTEGMIGAAERGSLDATVAEARAALAAMRDLLRDLRTAEAPVKAQPTLADLPALADKWRSHGREVTLRVTGTGGEQTVGGYRLVELLLAADTGPAELDVRADGDPIQITIRPAPDDPDGEIAAGLRARDGRIEDVTGGWEIQLRLEAGQGRWWA